MKDLDVVSFKKARQQEMFLAVFELNDVWNKKRKNLPDGNIILRFPKNAFVLVEVKDETISLPFITPFFFKIKSVTDFYKIKEINKISELEKILGNFTHWRTVDLQLPSSWSQIS